MEDGEREENEEDGCKSDGQGESETQALKTIDSEEPLPTRFPHTLKSRIEDAYVWGGRHMLD